MNEEIEQKPHESIKLIKNSRGYNWEIKIVGESINNYKLTNEELGRLNDLNKKLIERYGND